MVDVTFFTEVSLDKRRIRLKRGDDHVQRLNRGRARRGRFKNFAYRPRILVLPTFNERCGRNALLCIGLALFELLFIGFV